MKGLVIVKYNIEKSLLFNTLHKYYPFLIDTNYVIPTHIIWDIKDTSFYNEVYSEFSNYFSLLAHISDMEYIENVVNEIKYFTFLKNIKNISLFIRDFNFGLETIEYYKTHILMSLIEKEIDKIRFLITILNSMKKEWLMYEKINKNDYIKNLTAITKYLENYKNNNLELFV
jgi:hypothetical protein